MPPDPIFSFSIPSVHDDILLECRVYSPPPSYFLREKSDTNRILRGAVIAHPYASFGGCYDDHVVLGLATEILRLGFVVGTFNFRGAGGSKGRTSWTSKPEVDDYISFVGLFVHYLHALQLPENDEPILNSPHVPLSPIRTGVPLEQPLKGPAPQGTLILGGYSYGSLIATQLPPIEVIIERFAHVSQGTAEAEIRLRATSLAAQWNKDAQMHYEIHRGDSLKAPNVHETCPSPRSLAMGGHESEPGTRRASHESRRSLDAFRRSLERSHIHLGRRISGDVPNMAETALHLAPTQLVPPRICYLLVSPLLPPISRLAMLFSTQAKSNSGENQVDIKLASHHTLAIYGDKDVFTSRKKLRVWAVTLGRRHSSLFRFHEVAGAGHFWHERDDEANMRRIVCNWIPDIIQSAPANNP